MKTLVLTAVSVVLLNSTAFAQAKLQIIHNSPDPLLETVDIYVNGVFSVNSLDNISFRSATNYFDAQTDSNITVTVNRSGSNSSADSLLTQLELGTLNTFQAVVVIFDGVVDSASTVNPDGASTALRLYALTGANQSGTGGKADLVFYHGSPDAPTIDMVVDGGSTWVDNLPYPYYSSYVSVDAGYYELNMTDATGNTVLKKFQLPLATYADLSAVIFTSGFYNDLKLYGALGNETVVPYTQLVGIEDQALLQSIEVYPNPASEKLHVCFNLEKTTSVKLSILNTVGQKIIDMHPGTYFPGSNFISTDLRNLEPGYYFVNIDFDGINFNRSVMVE